MRNEYPEELCIEAVAALVQARADISHDNFKLLVETLIDVFGSDTLGKACINNNSSLLFKTADKIP